MADAAASALEKSLRLLRAQVVRRTVGLCRDFDLCPPVSLAPASGAVVSLQGRTFVFTAAHFISPTVARSFDAVFPTEDWDVPFATIDTPMPDRYEGPTSLSNRVKPVRAPIRCVRNQEDIGAIEISADVVPTTTVAHDLPLEPPAAPSPGQEVFLAGFPCSHQKTMTNGKIGALARCLVSLGTRVEDNPAPGVWIHKGKDTFNPERHFLINVNPRDIPNSSSLDVHGMSGCGIWRRKRTGAVWSPQVELIGVQVSVRGSKVKCNRLDSLLGLLVSASR